MKSEKIYNLGEARWWELIMNEGEVRQREEGVRERKR